MIALLALVIAASGSVAVGVAGYVIGGNANGDNGTVSINAGSAEVGNITVTGTVEDGAIYFAGNSTETVTGNGNVIGWDEGETEDLDASIKFVSAATNNAFKLNHHYTIALTTTIDSSVFAENTGYVSDAVAVTGLGTATSLTINADAVDVDNSVVSTLENSSGLTVDLTFAWGAAFGGKNPETYYTDSSYTGSATDFATTLNAFDAAVKDASFTLTLTPVLD